MKIESLSYIPIEKISYQTVTSNGRIVDTEIPVLLGEVTGISDSVKALIIASDLQGVVIISAELRGDEDIREILECGNKTTVICGHMYWKEPLVTLANESQVLNVDSRVVILINIKSHGIVRGVLKC